MDDRIKTGIMVFPTDYSIHPAELAVAAQATTTLKVATGSRVVFGTPPASKDIVLGVLDRLAELA